jgi:hypothetical protein
MKTTLPALALSSLLVAGCADDRSAGTDEHGNAVTVATVLDAWGEPAAGTEVVVRGAGWLHGDDVDSVSDHPDGFRLKTDAAGQVRIPSTDPSHPRMVRVGGVHSAAMLHLRHDTSAILRLNPVGAVQGSIAKVPEGTKVRLFGLEGMALTDASGRFFLARVPAGRVSLAVGEGASLMVIDRIEVRSGEAVSIGAPTMAPGDTIDAPADTSVGSHTVSYGPRFLPGPGTYTESQVVEIVPADPTDQVEISEDGRTWSVLEGSYRVMGTVCLEARVVRQGRIVSETVKACYILDP